MIDHKIKDILESYKKYDRNSSPQFLKNSPYIDGTALEVRVSPKRERRNRRADKENQNSNERKARPRRFKSVVEALQEIESNCQENRPR